MAEWLLFIAEEQQVRGLSGPGDKGKVVNKVGNEQVDQNAPEAQTGFIRIKKGKVSQMFPGRAPRRPRGWMNVPYYKSLARVRACT
jgi:hypothetical protein